KLLELLALLLHQILGKGVELRRLGIVALQFLLYALVRQQRGTAAGPTAGAKAEAARPLRLGGRDKCSKHAAGQDRQAKCSHRWSSLVNCPTVEGGAVRASGQRASPSDTGKSDKPIVSASDSRQNCPPGRDGRPGSEQQRRLL